MFVLPLRPTCGATRLTPNQNYNDNPFNLNSLGQPHHSDSSYLINLKVLIIIINLFSYILALSKMFYENYSYIKN